MNPQDIIQNNLYALYEAIGSMGLGASHKAGEYAVINASPEPWPNFIYLDKMPASESFWNTLDAGVRNKTLPPFIICPDTVDIAKKAALMSFRKIVQWPGMLRLAQGETGFRHQALRVREIKGASELKSWNRLVSDILFRGHTFSNAFIETLYKHSDIRLLGGFAGNKMVSTLMIYSQGVCSGFFMISTDKEERKKGYARAITAAAIDSFLPEKTRYVVLEANRESYRLYQSLGFEEYCKFDIYWRLGHE